MINICDSGWEGCFEFLEIGWNDRIEVRRKGVALRCVL
jgi:hypothetical protein